jgi:hypothetical protein
MAREMSMRQEGKAHHLTANNEEEDSVDSDQLPQQHDLAAPGSTQPPELVVHAR